MKRFIPLLLLIVCVCAVAASRRQFFSPKAVAAAPPAETYYPTNIGAGYYPTFVYDADSTTENPVATWADYNGGGYTLSNTVSKGPARTTSALNGHTITDFNGSDMYLRAGHPDRAAPYEIVMVIAPTNGANKYMIYTDNTPRVIFQTGGSGNLQQNAGAAVTAASTSFLEQWQVINLVINGANSLILTNCTSAESVHGDAANTNPFGNDAWSLGAYYLGSPGGYQGMKVAWFAVYPTNLDSTVGNANVWCADYGSARSNLFHWLTNRYAITP